MFDSGIVEVQRENSNALTREKNLSIASLSVVGEEEIESDDDGLNFAERALNRRKKNDQTIHRH